MRRLLLLGAFLAALPAAGIAQNAIPIPDSPVATPADGAAAEAARAAGELRDALGRFDAALGADDQVIALTGMIRAYEDGLAALREGLRHAAAREAELRAGFEERRDVLARVLAVMTTVGRAPEATLLLHPGGAAATARSGQVMSSVVPALRAEADTLSDSLAEIATVRRTQEAAAGTLAQGLGRVQQARQLLASAVSDRSTLPARFTEDPKEVQALKESADSLDAFAIGLAALESDVGPPLTDFEGAQGGLAMPVSGEIIRGYGEADAAGVKRPGIVIATAPRALVTTPWPATIRYRGPLLDYGNVMIIEPARGYLLILAGLRQVFGETGDVLAAGEPLGLMGGDEKTPAEFGVGFVVDAAKGGDAGRSETLYVELRKGRETLDPADWFATDPRVAQPKTPQEPSSADG